MPLISMFKVGSYRWTVCLGFTNSWKDLLAWISTQREAGHFSTIASFFSSLLLFLFHVYHPLSLPNVCDLAVSFWNGGARSQNEAAKEGIIDLIFQKFKSNQNSVDDTLGLHQWARLAGWRCWSVTEDWWSPDISCIMDYFVWLLFVLIFFVLLLQITSGGMFINLCLELNRWYKCKCQWGKLLGCYQQHFGRRCTFSMAQTHCLPYSIVSDGALAICGNLEMHRAVTQPLKLTDVLVMTPGPDTALDTNTAPAASLVTSMATLCLLA